MNLKFKGTCYTLSQKTVVFYILSAIASNQAMLTSTYIASEWDFVSEVSDATRFLTNLGCLGCLGGLGGLTCLRCLAFWSKLTLGPKYF